MLTIVTLKSQNRQPVSDVQSRNIPGSSSPPSYEDSLLSAGRLIFPGSDRVRWVYSSNKRCLVNLFCFFFWWASIIITENCNFIKSFYVFRKLIFSFTLAAESFLRKRLLPSLHFFADTDLALISCEREELDNARSAR